MSNLLGKIWQKITLNYITDSGVSAVFSETRDMGHLLTRDMKLIKNNYLLTKIWKTQQK